MPAIETIVADLLAARKLEAAYGVESTPPVTYAEGRLHDVVRAAVAAERAACAEIVNTTQAFNEEQIDALIRARDAILARA